MVLTDDEIRVLWAEAAKTAASHMAMADSFGRAVEAAVVERLIAECDRMHTGVTTYKRRLMGEMAGDWLRSKVIP